MTFHGTPTQSAFKQPMAVLAQPLLFSVVAILLTGACFARENSPPIIQATPAELVGLNRPISISLEARAVQRDGAFGLHVAAPVFDGTASTVLLEGYGFEGEGELGVIGGGVVYRRALGGRSAFEGSVFLEGLRSTDGFAYPQLGAGLGFSPDRWITLHANGYLPLRGKDSRRSGSERWSETEGSGAARLQTNWWREYFSERAPMRGFDVEAELRLPEPPRWIDPRVAVGYAYREAEDRPEVYAGVTVRGELHFAKHWIMETEWRNDAHGADQEWRVGVRFQMLFGGSAEKEEARANERYLPVQRFPWPMLARGSERGKTQRGDSRSLAPAQPPMHYAADPDDCCPSGNAPLSFE